MWTAVASVAALVLAVPGVVIGVAGFRRSSRAEDAKQRSDAAGVGLSYLEKALAAQQMEITRQEGLIGELRGHLESCREERQALAAEIADLRERMP